ncbi:hypothetical protein [Streptomyces rimosus]|uniref:hypothetical protein n=1 Tax=Streptomyces rimosus TaxID=1927 RepID=UPI0004C8F4F8
MASVDGLLGGRRSQEFAGPAAALLAPRDERPQQFLVARERPAVVTAGRRQFAREDVRTHDGGPGARTSDGGAVRHNVAPKKGQQHHTFNKR